MFFETSRRFSFSTRSLGHVMFSFAGTAQEAGARGRSGGSWYPCSRFIDGEFFFMYTASFTFLLVHCGYLVSTLVLSSETECPEQFPQRKTSRDFENISVHSKCLAQQRRKQFYRDVLRICKVVVVCKQL